MTEKDKLGASSGHPPPPQSQPFPPPQYCTFQGVSNFPPPLPPHTNQYPAIGFPQPVPPPGSDPSAPPPPYYPHGYQAFPGIVLSFSLFFLSIFLGFLIIEFDFYVENEKFKILIFWG
jgi:hypothetical protein